LDLNKPDWSEDMVRNRDPGSFILGDSGGFQIAKGLWEGDWKAGSQVVLKHKRNVMLFSSGWTVLLTMV
jgi:hypothetical protein